MDATSTAHDFSLPVIGNDGLEQEAKQELSASTELSAPDVLADVELVPVWADDWDSASEEPEVESAPCMHTNGEQHIGGHQSGLPVADSSAQKKRELRPACGAVEQPEQSGNQNKPKKTREERRVLRGLAPRPSAHEPNKPKAQRPDKKTRDLLKSFGPLSQGGWPFRAPAQLPVYNTTYDMTYDMTYDTAYNPQYGLAHVPAYGPAYGPA